MAIEWNGGSITTRPVEGLSPGVGKHLCKFFKLKGFLVCNAFSSLHTILVDLVEVWNGKNAFPTPQLNASFGLVIQVFQV